MRDKKLLGELCMTTSRHRALMNFFVQFAQILHYFQWIVYHAAMSFAHSVFKRGQLGARFVPFVALRARVIHSNRALRRLSEQIGSLLSKQSQRVHCEVWSQRTCRACQPALCVQRLYPCECWLQVGRGSAEVTRSFRRRVCFRASSLPRRL